MTPLRAEALLLLVTLVWGGTFTVIKSALATITPSTFVLTRFGIATALAVAIWPRSLRLADRDLLVKGLVLGGLFGIGFVLQSIGLALTSASSSAFITGTMVAFVPFVFRIIEGTRVQRSHIVTVGVVILGLWLFTEPEAKGINLGDVLTLIAAVLWAVYIVYIDLWTKELREQPQKLNLLVILQFASTVVIALMGTWFLDAPHTTTQWSIPLVGGILYCAILASVFTTWAQTRFQQYTHPVRAGVIYAMEPIFAAVIALIALHESWSWRQGIGAGVIVGAVIIPDILLLVKRARS